MQLVGIIDAIKYIYICIVGVVSHTLPRMPVDGCDAVGVGAGGAHAKQQWQQCASTSLARSAMISTRTVAIICARSIRHTVVIPPQFHIYYAVRAHHGRLIRCLCLVMEYEDNANISFRASSALVLVLRSADN